MSPYDILPSPCNPKELFNRRHASARNVIEQIFGILKQQFQILQLPPEYGMEIQAQIPPVLAALYNFIRTYDPDDVYDDDDEDEDNKPLNLQMGPHPNSVGQLRGLVTPQELARANQRRDKITSDMWEQYQHVLAARAAHDEKNQ
jgi:hypothetical protein